MGDPEGFLLQRSITVGDGETPLSQFVVELLYRYRLSVADAGHGVGGVFLLGKQGEVFLCPGAYVLGDPPMAVEAGLQPLFLQNPVQGEIQGVGVGDRGGGGILEVPLLHVLEQQEHIEVVPPLFDSCGALLRLLRDRGQTQSRGQPQSLLAGGDADIDAQLVHLDLGSSQGGDRVDTPHHLRVPAKHLGQLL